MHHLDSIRTQRSETPWLKFIPKAVYSQLLTEFPYQQTQKHLLQIAWVKSSPSKMQSTLSIEYIAFPSKQMFNVMLGYENKTTPLTLHVSWNKQFGKANTSKKYSILFWLVVSTHLKNISQNGNLPQIGVKINNFWNHHLVFKPFRGTVSLNTRKDSSKIVSLDSKCQKEILVESWNRHPRNPWKPWVFLYPQFDW